MKIHPTAIIEDGAILGDGIIIGEFSIIRANVVVGSKTIISPRVIIEGKSTIGKNCFIGVGSVIGNRPQDLKYKGEDTEVIIGDNTTLREYVTVNRGTSDRMKTKIGKNALLMTYVHIAHDCYIGNEAILSNGVQLAGHVTIEDKAIMGGLTAAHQFTTIGRTSIVGGMSRVVKDVPPFCTIAGNPSKVYGLNIVGLKRRKYPKNDIEELKKVHKILFRSHLNTSQAIKKLDNQKYISESAIQLINFVKNSSRGITK